MLDICELLLADHKRICDLLDHIASDRNWEGRLPRLKQELQFHEQFEERIYYRLVPETQGIKDSPAIQISAEHTKIQADLEEILKNTGQYPADILDKMTALGELIKGHIEREETTIFPAVRHTLKDDKTAAFLADQYQKFRRGRIHIPFVGNVEAYKIVSEHLDKALRDSGLGKNNVDIRIEEVCPGRFKNDLPYASYPFGQQVTPGKVVLTLSIKKPRLYRHLSRLAPLLLAIILPLSSQGIDSSIILRRNNTRFSVIASSPRPDRLVFRNDVEMSNPVYPNEPSLVSFAPLINVKDLAPLLEDVSVKYAETQSFPALLDSSQNARYNHGWLAPCIKLMKTLRHSQSVATDRGTRADSKILLCHEKMPGKQHYGHRTVRDTPLAEERVRAYGREYAEAIARSVESTIVPIVIEKSDAEWREIDAAQQQAREHFRQGIDALVDEYMDQETPVHNVNRMIKQHQTIPDTPLAEERVRAYGREYAVARSVESPIVPIVIEKSDAEWREIDAAQQQAREHYRHTLEELVEKHMEM